MQLEVFPILHQDAITDTAISDPLIVALEEVHFMSSIVNRIKRKNYRSYRMRLAARLLLLLRKEMDHPEATMWDALDVGYLTLLQNVPFWPEGKPVKAKWNIRRWP
ncbi:hypothetical protein DPMN_143218 [Dreissena polymorpha]|uniref:Uncharacterized protein n=1 Tax=Dreissena polymorpha TaxID=45954 RepID=A0A9D4GFU9_DREPO|nr:hypothetical protein DPMN_143218 [Dreissena polymorpha]